jgi:Bacterial TSP3 repeat
MVAQTHAMLDQDGDGMSDVWESQNGFSSTSSTLPGQGPTQDPDGDGVSNLLESIAGTNPLSTTPPSGTFRLAYANPQATTLQWQGITGKLYQLSTSPSLAANSWTLLNQPIAFSTGNIGSITTPPRTAASAFYRATVSDLDSDADNLTDAEEAALGTNPNSPDSDGDGIQDIIETTQDSSPTDASDNGLPQPPAALLPMKLKIYMSASLMTDYDGGGQDSLLTPYRIKIYRQNLASGAETLVHTTPDYGGNAFSLIDNVELPNLANDPTQRYTAQIDLPPIGTDIFSQPLRRWSFLVTISASVGGAPFVAVNGFEPISQTFGTTGSILRAFKIFNPQYENYRATIEPAAVSWKPILGFDNVSAHIDPWGQAIAGAKIFPDYKNPLDNVLRAKLQVVVKTSSALAGKTIFVKAFDVDDSTSEAFDTTGGAPPVVDTNGKSGNDNLPDYLNTPQTGQFWTGAGWGTDTAQGIVDSNGETKFDFRVGMQPGNNYRIIASVVDQSMITDVQVTSATASKYLGPELAQTGGAPASPLLTVWRRVWVENDSMASIPVDTLGFKRNDLSSLLTPPVIRNRSFSAATNETSFGIDLIQDQSSFLTLQNGKMITQSIVHPVVGTSSYEVRVVGNYANVPVNSIYRLYDDDDYGVAAPPLPRLDLVNDFMKSLFRPAFVELIDSGSFNLDKIIPFKLNDDLQSQTLVNSKKDLTEKDALWVAPITAAYQFDSTEDGDPNLEIPTEGATRPFGNYAHATVFIECCREPYDSDFRLVNEGGGNPQTGIDALRNFQNLVTAQSAHEVGHLPLINALDHHLELGLMRKGGALPFTPEQSKFSPMTISRFRQTKKWSNR